MHDLDLTSPGHSRSKQMPPNERPYDFLSIIYNKFGRICKGFQVTAKLRPSETCLASIWPLQANPGQT